ncbi:MAG: T9SS type A sorting domain-containing protein [Bacteroidales bacterium]
MKKINLLLIILLFTAFTVNAQITITQSDMPSVNMTFTEVIDTNCTNINIGSSGTNQTWNLSNIGNSYQETSTWLNPSSRPGAASFPTATHAVVTPGGQDSYVRISATSVDMLGINGDFGAPLGVQSGVFSPAMKYFQLPTNYQTTFNGTSSFEIKIAYTGIPLVDSVRTNYSVNYSCLVDGWGNLTTPAFSNVPSLRQKNTSINTIGIFVHNTFTNSWTSYSTQKDTTINYMWLSNLKKFTLANVETDWNGNVLQATYLMSSGVVGINENNLGDNKIEVFPNPANNFINLNGCIKNSVALIFDSNGKLLYNQLLKSNQNRINTTDYSDGIYFYQIVDINGKSIEKGKFAISK